MMNIRRFCYKSSQLFDRYGSETLRTVIEPNANRFSLAPKALHGARFSMGARSYSRETESIWRQSNALKARTVIEPYANRFSLVPKDKHDARFSTGVRSYFSRSVFEPYANRSPLAQKALHGARFSMGARSYSSGSGFSRRMDVLVDKWDKHWMTRLARVANTYLGFVYMSGLGVFTWKYWPNIIEIIKLNENDLEEILQKLLSAEQTLSTSPYTLPTPTPTPTPTPHT